MPDEMFKTPDLPVTNTDPRKVIKGSRRNVELIRACLPIHDYIKLLHVGIVTGQMPVFDQHGKQVPDKFTPVTARDRIELTKFMIDKAMPNTGPPKVAEEAEAIDPNSAELESLNEKDISQMSDEDLRSLTDAEFTVEKPSE